MKRSRNTATPIESYRKTLTAIRSELSSSVRAAIEEKPWADEDPFIGIGAARLDAIQLAAVDDSLKRIDLGAYGLCSDCGQAISDRRLAAIPWVKRCIACQEELAGSSGESAERRGHDRHDRDARS